ncbi:CHAT domain-containing tetratricopeptide repeat protein [Parerythrobacter lacustris]|uniref:CHAT domain-containing protein n=1 Tax=Parerythrobacter lacustris TaxID=2969984 RepID=A0ABT1XW73_9SPHN|nr:CHAT domain-containing protein [Parerythrobacter lacustris]MCR2834692.1 CHAT domain-containing protein [Parerythrobacter lacustris]
MLGTIAQDLVRASRRNKAWQFVALISACLAQPLAAQETGESPNLVEAVAAYNRGEFEEALVLSQQAIDALGAESDATAAARTAATHGAILIALERPGDAVPLLEAAYRNADTALGRTDPATLYVHYTYGMALFHTGRMHEAHVVLTAHREAENEALGRDDLLDMQRYSAASLTHLSSLAQARMRTGNIDGGLALFTGDLEAINIGVGDMRARTDFLADIYEFHDEIDRLGDIPLEEAASYVSRSEALGDYAGDNVYDQLYYLARINEGAGKLAEARALDLRIPWRVEDLFWAAEETDETAAFALLAEAAGKLQANCEIICSNSAALIEIREFQGRRLDFKGDDAGAAKAYEGALYAAQRSYPRDEAKIISLQDELLYYYDRLGRTEDMTAMKLERDGTEPDPDLDGNVALTIARRLRELGFANRADAIVAKQMACAYPDPTGKETFYQPCSSAWMAMSEYSKTLDPKREKDKAEFYRLPQEAISAYLKNDGETARAKADRLVDLGLKLFEPTDHNLYLAMGIYRGVSSWQYAKPYEIPARWRICELSTATLARLEAQAKAEAAARASLTDDMTPPPMMAVSVRAPEPYFSFGYGHLSPQDPKGAFYNALKGGLQGYAADCLIEGRPEDAVRFLDWAATAADSMGYPLGDQEGILLTKAQLEREMGRTGDAERSYLRLVDAYLSGKAKEPGTIYIGGSFFESRKALQELIQFYSQLGKAEQLLILLTKMEESGQFGNKEYSGSETQFRPIREAMFIIFLAKREIDKAAKILPYLEPWSVIAEARYGRMSEDELAEFERQQISSWALHLAEFAEASGESEKALDYISEAIDANDAYLAAQPAMPEERFDIRGFLLNGRLYSMRAGIFGRMALWPEALEAMQGSGIFEFGDTLIEFARKEIGPEASDAQLLALMASDKSMGQLFAVYAAAYAAAAEAAMRAGDEAAAERYLQRSLDFPQDTRWSLFQQQTRYVGVALGVRKAEWRARGLESAKSLVEGLEQQWRLASRSSLDAGMQLDMMQMAPAMFGEVLALWWREKADGGTPASDEQVFRNIQWSIMGAADLAIAQSIARSSLTNDDPAFNDLIAERDLVSSTLYKNARTGQEVKYGEQGESEFSANVDRLRAIEDKIATDYPRFYEITTSEPVELDKVQGLLSEDEAMLLVSPGRFGTQMVMVTRDGMRWQQSDMTLDEVDLAVRRLRFFLGAGNASAAETREWSAAVDGGWQGFDRETANRLYREFITPFADLLDGRKKLLVSPGGPLGSLPFSVLVSEIASGRDDDPDTLRATRWLIDEFELTQIPAVRSFVLLREEKRVRSVGDLSFAGFGDPLLEGEAKARGARGTRGPKEVIGDLWNGAAIDLAVLRKMDRLPGTARELQSLREAFGSPESSVKLGVAATERLVRTSDLKQVDVIAFATHGIMAGEVKGLAEPGLIFSPPQEATAMDDGYLTASEIAGLDLSAEWIILSACNTAASDGKAGASALSGLARSFFHAGARSLLVSHWYIRDDVAALLTAKAVEARRDDPQISRAGALQAAMTSIRVDKSADGKQPNDRGELVETSWAHPSAWAPFTLVSGE